MFTALSADDSKADATLRAPRCGVTCTNRHVCVCVWLGGGVVGVGKLNSKIKVKHLQKLKQERFDMPCYWVKGLHTQEPPVSAVINRLQLILAVNDQRVWVVGKKKVKKDIPTVT